VTAWLPLIMDNIPAELRALGWVGWRAELGEDRKWKKPPCQIGEPRRSASNADPSHWRNEGDVREVQIMAPELFDGFGVALVQAANLTFVDVGRCARSGDRRNRRLGNGARPDVRLLD